MTDGCDAITVRDADNGWSAVGCEGLLGCAAMEVVMAGTCVCNYAHGINGVVEDCIVYIYDFGDVVICG